MNRRAQRSATFVALFTAWASISFAATTYIVTPDPVTVPEGGTATVTVTLDGNPSPDFSTFTTSFIGGDADLSITGPTGGTLDGTNWNTGITITIQAAVDADTTNGNASFEVTETAGPFGLPPLLFQANENDGPAPAPAGGGGGGGGATEEKKDPATKLASTVNLENTRVLRDVVVRGLFLMPVRPVIVHRPPTGPVGVPPVGPGAKPTGPEAGPGNKPTTGLDLDHDYAMAQQLPPSTTPTWGLNLTSSARYAHTEYYDFNHSSSDRAGISLNGAHEWDRWSLNVTVPLDIVDFDKDLQEYNYWRIGAAAIPRYKVLTEEQNGMDLTVGATGYYMRTNMVTDEFHNPDHMGVGLLAGAQKWFGNVAVSGGVLVQRAWNLDESEEITGKRYVNVVSAGVNVGMPIGDNWAVNAMLLYDHTSSLPDWLDRDTFMTGASVSYVVSDKWTLETSVMTDVANEDERKIEVHMGLGWQF